MWYVEDTPTHDAANDEIPEFQDILAPLIGTMVAFTVVRRRFHANGRKGQATPIAT